MNKQFLSLLLLASFVTSSVQSAAGALKAIPEACFTIAKNGQFAHSLPTLGMRNFANIEPAKAAFKAAAAATAGNVYAGVAAAGAVGLGFLGSIEVFYKNYVKQEALNNRTFTTKVLDAVKNNAYVLGSVATAAALGGATYGLMSKYSKKTDKKVNAGVATGVAATTGVAAYFGKNGLSYVGDKLSPLGSTVKNAIVNNKYIAGTLVGVTALGGLVYLAATRDLFSTANSIEQNQEALKATVLAIQENGKALQQAKFDMEAAQSIDKSIFSAKQALVKQLTNKSAVLNSRLQMLQETIAAQEKAVAEKAKAKEVAPAA